MTVDNLKLFIARCAQEDPEDSEARITFQEQYGPLIYTFPMCILHRSAEVAGDFYLYVFEEGRIFRRMKTFEARNGMKFETFLSFYVLRHLFFSWERSLGPKIERGQQEMLDILSSEDGEPEVCLIDAEQINAAVILLRQLDIRPRVVLKLLALAAIDLEPEEIRYIADRSQRSLRETLTVIEEVRRSLYSKAIKAEEQQEQLSTIFSRIVLLQRHLHDLTSKIEQAYWHGNTNLMEQLLQERDETEGKLAWRRNQQEKSREKFRKSQTHSASYDDIAKILAVPKGTACAWISSARTALKRLLEAAHSAPV